MAPPAAISVKLGQNIWVAGSFVHGIVDLNVRLLQEEQVEEVHVKLRGIAWTAINGAKQAHRRQVELVRADTSVWTRGSAYPRPDSHMLTLPFQLPLPPDLPPSFACDHSRGSGTIQYYVEVVGSRPGALKLNRRIARPIAVLPADPAGSRLKEVLEGGWQGPWRTSMDDKMMRRGFWGGYADVEMKLVYPDITIYPLFTNIPFALTITTISKPVKKKTSNVWPTPPLRPRDIEFQLRRVVRVSVGLRRLHWREWMGSLGGLGSSQGRVDVESPDKEWLPSKDNPSVGRWKQQVTFSSLFQLHCPPTFESETMSADYHIVVRAHFEGFFKRITLRIPLVAVSGMEPPVSSPEDELIGTSDIDGPEYINSDTLDLPPSYWRVSRLQEEKA